MAINFKKVNLTIVDETNVKDLLKIDSINPTNTPANYYNLIEEKFIFGRYLYEKATMKPLGYWICREEIGNNYIVAWNSVLKLTEFCDTVIEFYRTRCHDEGNTLILPVSELQVELCNHLKKHNPITKYVEPFIEFKFFTRYQQEFLDREMHIN